MGDQGHEYLVLEFFLPSVLVFEKLKVGFVFRLYVLLRQDHEIARYCDVLACRALVSVFYRSSGGGGQTTMLVSPHDWRLVIRLP